MTTQRTQVILRNAPVDVWRATRIWFDELVRELEIIAIGSDAEQPRAFLELVNEVRAFRDVADDGGRLEEAATAGDRHVEVIYSLPSSAGPLALDLWQQYEEVTAYCRRGGLMTTTAPEQVERFVDWMLHEVARQLEGAPPSPWPDSETSL